MQKILFSLLFIYIIIIDLLISYTLIDNTIFLATRPDLHSAFNFFNYALLIILATLAIKTTWWMWKIKSKKRSKEPFIIIIVFTLISSVFFQGMTSCKARSNLDGTFSWCRLWGKGLMP